MDKSDIVNIVQKEFSFLITEYQFRFQAELEANTSFTLHYLSREIGIDVEVELVDFYIYVLLVRLVDGELPPAYYSEAGVTYRRHLMTTLDQCSLLNPDKKRQIRELGGDHRNASALARKLAELLKENIEFLLENWSCLFNQEPDRLLGQRNA